MVFEIFYAPDCLKRDLSALDRTARLRIKRAIESRLSTSPDIFGKPLRHTLRNLWSLRVGDFRVIYEIHKNAVRVIRIGHRREVYDG